MSHKTTLPASIQLIVIDIDGTLFNSKQKVSSTNIAAIRAALSAGVRVALASGRGRAGITEVLRITDLDLPFICSAGAGIYPGKSSAPFHLDLIRTDERLSRALSVADNHGLGWIADLTDGFLWKGDDSLTSSMDPFSRQSMRIEDRIENNDALMNKEVLKISFFTPPKVRDAVKTAFNEVAGFESVYAGLNYIDLTNNGVNKGAATKILANEFSISLTAAAAIGDQEIDLPMFEEVGVSIAVSNAPKAIQAAADILAPSNDDDGVAWAIEQLLG